jgi:hypothetical protein
MKIEHTEHSPNGLVRETWLFAYSESQHALVVTSYVRAERKSTRARAYRVTHRGGRCESERAAYAKGEYMPIVPLPADVAAKALASFTNGLKATL